MVLTKRRARRSAVLASCVLLASIAALVGTAQPTIAAATVIAAVQPSCDGATVKYPATAGQPLLAGDVGVTDPSGVAWFNGMAARKVTWLSSLDCTAMPTSSVSAQWSHNWSGYVISPTTNYGLLGMAWSVPATSGTIGADSAVWAGQGGFNGNGDLPQAGTESDRVLGSTNAYAWWEIWPDNSQQKINNFTIKVGDSVSELISVNPDRTVEFNICDIFTNKCVAIYKTAAKTIGGSAEWVVERPTVSGKFTQLANFGSVTTSSDSFTTNGKNYYPSNGLPYDMRACNNTTILDSVGPYSSTFQQFSVTWKAYGTVEHC